MSSKCKVYDNWQKKRSPKKVEYLKIKGDIKGNFSKVGARATSRPKADQKKLKADDTKTIKKLPKVATFTPTSQNL